MVTGYPLSGDLFLDALCGVVALIGVIAVLFGIILAAVASRELRPSLCLYIFVHGKAVCVGVVCGTSGGALR